MCRTEWLHVCEGGGAAHRHGQVVGGLGQVIGGLGCPSALTHPYALRTCPLPAPSPAPRPSHLPTHQPPPLNTCLHKAQLPE